MTALLRALAALAGWGWWRFVVITSGPRHHSYVHACWMAWTYRERLLQYLRTGE